MKERRPPPALAEKTFVPGATRLGSEGSTSRWNVWLPLKKATVSSIVDAPTYTTPG
jgi:hypothetical protein